MGPTSSLTRLHLHCVTSTFHYFLTRLLTNCPATAWVAQQQWGSRTWWSYFQLKLSFSCTLLRLQWSWVSISFSSESQQSILSSPLSVQQTHLLVCFNSLQPCLCALLNLLFQCYGPGCRCNPKAWLLIWLKTFVHLFHFWTPSFPEVKYCNGQMLCFR